MPKPKQFNFQYLDCMLAFNFHKNELFDGLLLFFHNLRTSFYLLLAKTQITNEIF
jgi:hypothetical protein